MVLDLRQIAWMRLQWKRFRNLLWGGTGAVWLLCCSGILLVDEGQFLVRMALLIMLAVSTVLGVWFLWTARREIKTLERMAIEVRAEAIRNAKAHSGHSLDQRSS